MNSQRLSSVTVFGGINNVTGAFVWTLNAGTTQEGWKEFLRELREYEDSHYVLSVPVLICDNHSMHRAMGVVPYYAGFKVLFTPPYSSDLNAIETIWAIFGATLSKHIDRMPKELTQLAYEAEIDFICSQIADETDIKRLCHAARADLLKALEN